MRPIAPARVIVPPAPVAQPTPPPPPAPTATAAAEASLAPTQYADLFDRIRAGFMLPDPRERAIDEQLNWYASHPEYLQRAFGRADMYLYYIVKQLEKRHMPLELALLPVIESAYQPFAYSSARAAGLWQFIRGTGTRFGLKEDWWYDGRRDVVASTNAALDYLQSLHTEFNGDWLLAIAAYNCGGLAVQHAVQVNEAEHRPIDFWHLRLPLETEAYVPKLLAMKRLVADPARYGLDFSPIPNQPYFVKVPTDGQINLQVAAQIAGITAKEVYDLNPAFHRWATDPTGPFYLLLPVTAAPVFEQNLAELTADQRMGVENYVVRRGDSIYGVARRFKTSVELLRKLNTLPNGRLTIGSDLEVPATAYVLPEQVRLAAARVDEHAGWGTHVQFQVVRPGDSLWTIASRYRMTVAALARMNGLSPHQIIRPGERLRLFTRMPMERHGEIRFQVVRTGDTLWSIAHRHGMSVKTLLSLNGLRRGEILHPGERLRLYTHEARGGRVARPAYRHASVGSARAHRVFYIVRAGDTLWRIAHRFRVKVAQILAWNAISLHRPILAGQRLMIRVASAGG
ncbi:MAG TPA: LysM peptidoglycan-binding domain-containing protein [Steroidobacteraceae bacterium]|nr:LysM peptidoglycan-binding domain-containing protein [Steroidobacteraceae bacterium]